MSKGAALRIHNPSKIHAMAPLTTEAQRLSCSPLPCYRPLLTGKILTSLRRGVPIAVFMHNANIVRRPCMRSENH